MRIAIYIIVGIFFIISAPAYAQMKISLYDLPDRLSPDGGKGYNYLLDDLIKDFPYSVKQKYAPLRRNASAFLRGEGDCIFPSNVKVLSAGHPAIKDMDILSSKQIDVVSVYFYVPRGKQVPTTLSDLYHKSIGHIIGNAAVNFIKNEPINLHGARSNESLIEMLKRDRLEGIMGFHPDMPIAFEALGYTGLEYSPKLTLLKAPVVFVCHASSLTKSFIEHVDKMIPIMARDGRTQKYLGKHAEVIAYPSEQYSN